jgi:uncharacterized protein with HEPN domain
MSQRDDAAILGNIIAAGRELAAFTRGMSREQFLADRRTQAATLSSSCSSARR